MSAHIAVVDDDPDVRETVAEHLRRSGFAVSEAAGGAALRRLMAERPIDLAILDLNMPDEDGFSVAREVRRCGSAGIIMLTASADPTDMIVGLEVGADHYVAKPWNARELLARVRALLRRLQEGTVAAATLGREVQVGRYRLNLDSRRLYDSAGQELPLTAMEFDLLAAFVARPGRVLSRDQLLDVAHNKEMEPFDRSIDTRITRIRRKIEDNPAKPRWIRTVRGAGYVFAPGGVMPGH